MNTRSRRQALLTMLTLVTLPTAVAAQPNLVSNGNFDSGLGGWNDPLEPFWDYGGAAHHQGDAGGAVNSGSARLFATPDAGLNVWEINQCVDVLPSTSYQYGAQVALQGVVGPDFLDALIQVDIYDVPDCDLNVGSTGGSNEFTEVVNARWMALANQFTTGPATQSAQVRLLVRGGEEGQLQQAWWDDVFLREGAGSCRPRFAHVLCLNRNRFEVQATYSVGGVPGETGGNFQLTDDSGVFWFFSEGNLELNVKVLDGCGFNGHYWVLAAGSTDVLVTVFVIDTVTSEILSYFHPGGSPFETVIDNRAFPCT